MEIQEQSEKELKELKGFLKKNYYEKVDYDFFEVEGEGEAVISLFKFNYHEMDWKNVSGLGLVSESTEPEKVFLKLYKS
ncbi:hypothetical protein HK099_007589 [Clydaea vesicula]|uniref:Uncharacterized protein n=1 Tax=Clydaea vesicula TaxID=447962 RepID=A0AAD5Y0J5_9FUNG|nr:hypothetical protein HK099_007589 [Clydaea vesicula]